MLCLLLTSVGYAVDVAPQFVGNGAADSIYITIATIDTTYYPKVTNVDSLVILRYGPDGVVDDSLGEDAATVKNLTTGYYRIALRGSDASATLGTYTIVVKTWYAGALRGISSGAYHVLDEAVETYWTRLDAPISTRGTSNFDYTTNQIIVGTNNDKAGYSISGTKQTLDALVDLSAGAVYTYFTSGANEDPFKATVSNLALEASVTKVRDSVSLASIWSEAEKDSVLAQTFGIALYWGAMNGYRMINFPGTTTYVDSMWHVKSGVSPDSVKATTYVTFNAQYVAGSRFIIW